MMEILQQSIARFTSPHSLSSADRILNNRSDGIEIAFERAKTSSRYENILNLVLN